jgi:glycosyltransferase involved in cell wall biosynthesis
MTRFSLVLATIGRTGEVQRFLQHLAAQSYRSFELIVVDQNRDDRLIPILTEYASSTKIVHLRSEKGLSRARNIGLRHISGNVVAFPDDDCWYPSDLLERVAEWFTLNPGSGGLTGRSEDEVGQPSQGRWQMKGYELNRNNVWKSAISYSIFLRDIVIKTVGDFDESLGIGAGTPWGSAEETDYLLKALSMGARMFYEPSVVIHHGQAIREFDRSAMSKAFSYGAGMGRVLRKHTYPLAFVAYQWLRPAGGIVVSLMLGKFRKATHHWNTFLGRIWGWLITG